MTAELSVGLFGVDVDDVLVRADHGTKKVFIHIGDVIWFGDIDRVKAVLGHIHGLVDALTFDAQAPAPAAQTPEVGS